MSRPFFELLHPDDALSLIREWAAAAPHAVEVLPCAPEDGQRTLEALQVTTRSPLGALGYHTGGLLLDRGWLRILGAGCDRLPRALDRWNGLGTEPPSSATLPDDLLSAGTVGAARQRLVAG
ncbi:MAG: DUF2625 domain-containing protein, partial [Myxococcales bacterium]|nr:DUF2625 domain-containing protein [Myxococcales bacterium]